MNRLVAFAVAALAAWSAHAQSPAPKIAVTSLIADTMFITLYRERTGTNIGNPSNAVSLSGTALDFAVLTSVQDAVMKAVPAASTALLRVPLINSDANPNAFFEGDKVAATNPVLEALRKQGFTHVIAATKLRHSNIVRLRDSVIGTGTLEGIGFYIDPTIVVERSNRAERSEGIIAPYVYIQLRLVDLGAMEVRAVEKITANSVAASAMNPDGTDAWGALSAQQKLQALDRLIRQNVTAAVPALFQAK